MAWSLNSVQITTVNDSGTCTIWSPDTGGAIAILVLRLVAGTIFAHGVAWSPDGIRAATVDNNGAYVIWSLETGEEATMFTSRTDWVDGIDWSPSGTRLAIIPNWAEAHTVWDPVSGCPAATHTTHTNLVGNSV